MVCERWAVVVVPFPFSDQPGSKRRPALAISGRAFNESGHTTMAMITTRSHSPWPGDTPIDALEHAGLEAPCIVRLKLFTLDNRLIVRALGELAEHDHRRVAGHLRTYLFG